MNFDKNIGISDRLKMNLTTERYTDMEKLNLLWWICFLGSRQFSLLLHLPQKTMFNSKSCQNKLENNYVDLNTRLSA